MSGRGRGGTSRGGGRGGYVYSSATKLPEDRDVQEGRQPNLLSLGGPPRIGTYNDSTRRGKGRGAGPSRGGSSRGGAGGGDRERTRDNGYRHHSDPSRPVMRAADTYRPAEETFKASLPSRPPPQAPSGPRWRTEPESGPSRQHSSYNPPSPHHKRFDHSASRHSNAPPSEFDYNPPSPGQVRHLDELQNDVKPDIAQPPPSTSGRATLAGSPSMTVPAAAPPRPAAHPNPEAEAFKRMQRFKPGPSNRTHSAEPTATPMPVGGATTSSERPRDVKPTIQELEEPEPVAEPTDDPSRPSGVLALTLNQLPTEIRARNPGIKKDAREKVVATQTKILATQGRQIVRGGVRWRDDGCSIDWVKLPATPESSSSTAAPAPVPESNGAPQQSSNPHPRASSSGWGVDPRPIPTPRSAVVDSPHPETLGPHGTPPPASPPAHQPASVKKKKKLKGLTSPDDLYPGRPENISTEKWNSLSTKGRKIARDQAETAADEDSSALPKRKPKKILKKSKKRDRSPDEDSLRLSSDSSDSSASSADKPLAKRKRTSTAPSEAKPSITPSRQTQLPTPTPSDPDLAALAKIGELETLLKNKVIEIDRWTKMQKDYPELQKKTQGQIDGLQEEIGRLFDEIQRLKGRD